MATLFLRCRFLCNSPSPSLINEISRVLSDHRLPHHDLESALIPFSTSLPSLLPHLLRRNHHLPPHPLHRLFLFSLSLHPPPSPHSHLLFLSLLSQHRLFPLFWAHLSDFSTASPDAFHLLFRAYAAAKLPSDATRAFDRMREFSLSPSVDDLNILLLSLCRNGFFSQANDFFSIAGPTPNAKSYTILIHHSPSAANALSLFSQLCNNLDSAAVDVIVFNALIAALCKTGDLDSAFEKLKEMRKVYSLEPDAATYSAFVRTYCAVKDAHSALKMLENMRRKNLSPNVYTYNCIIRLLCEKGEIDEAYAILDEMKTPDVWSYNAIMAVHCSMREANKVVRLMKKMDADGCLPDRHTYNMVMKMLIGVGRIEWAVEVWDGMEKRGFYPAAASYAVIIHGLCRKKGRAMEASKYFEVMVEEGVPPYLSTCEVLRGELLRFGMRERVEVLADRMRRSTSCTIQELASAMEGRKRSGNVDHGPEDRVGDAVDNDSSAI